MRVLRIQMPVQTNFFDTRLSTLEPLRVKTLQWLLPIVTLTLILTDGYWMSMNGAFVTAVASSLILLMGIPHGTLDVEIAAHRFGQHDVRGKLIIVSTYCGGAAAMALLWMVAPSLALGLFLVLSIIHFGGDWRTDGDEFLGMTVGWALISLPALSHPEAVAAIFETLTGDQNGATIAAILACTSIPAISGSLIFAAKAIKRADHVNGINVLSCLFAALLLPPLVGFAIFFCGLHSPRHLVEAIRQSGPMPYSEKLLRGTAVMALSLGAGALLFATQRLISLDAGIVRTAFVLLSILTVPHFFLEQLTDNRPANEGES